MLRIRHRGQTLNSEELIEISENYKLTTHAKSRIGERFPDLDVKQLIRNPVLAYFNTDGSINIALNEYEYLVVVAGEYEYRVVTFKEKSFNNITIYEKQALAKQGYIRKNTY